MTDGEARAVLKELYLRSPRTLGEGERLSLAIKTLALGVDDMVDLLTDVSTPSAEKGS